MPLPVTIPNTFANATTSIPLSQLDSNFSTLANAINGINSGSETVANLRSSNVTITGGIISNVTLDNVTVDVETLSNVTINGGNVTVTNMVATTANANTINVTTINARDGTASMSLANTTGILSLSNALVTTAGTSAAPAIYPTGDPNTGIFFPAADTIAFTEGGAESMRIDSSGNVGIGTTSPATPLHVRGANNEILRLQSSDATTGSLYLSYVDSAGTEKGYVGYGSSVTNDFIISNALSGDTRFNTNGTERMRIDSSGNVGIGTSSPATTLDVSVALPSAQINATTGTNRVWLRTVNTGGDFYFGRENSAGNSFGVTAYSSVLWSQGAYPMVFATNNTERMRIDSSGVVSLGITTAGSNAGAFTQLQLGGSSAANSRTTFFGQNNASAGGIVSNGYFDASNNLVYSQAYGVSRLYLNDGTFVFSNAASGTAGTNVTLTERMRLTATGKLAINTTQPFEDYYDNERPVVTIKNESSSTTVDSIALTLVNGSGVQNSSIALQFAFIAVGRRMPILVGKQEGAYGNDSQAVASLQFKTVNSNAFVTALDLRPGGQVKALNTISVGNATPSTSGAGITFPATQSASSDANTLDDYEEGTWTPTAYGGTTTGTTTYTTQSGKYTKIGNVVYIALTLDWSALTGTGQLRIGGLPFTPNNPVTGTVMPSNLNWTGGTQLNVYVNNTTYLELYGCADDAALSSQQCVNESAGLYITMFYYV